MEGDTAGDCLVGLFNLEGCNNMDTAQQLQPGSCMAILQETSETNYIPIATILMQLHGDIDFMQYMSLKTLAT